MVEKSHLIHARLIRALSTRCVLSHSTHSRQCANCTLSVLTCMPITLQQYDRTNDCVCRASALQQSVERIDSIVDSVRAWIVVFQDNVASRMKDASAPSLASVFPSPTVAQCPMECESASETFKRVAQQNARAQWLDACLLIFQRLCCSVKKNPMHASKETCIEH